MQVRTVSQVTRYIKFLLDGDPELTDLWVEGEISNFRRAESGHWYFTLKDQESELPCVMWRFYAGSVGWQPRQGDWVDAHGSISVYEQGGRYQFYVDTLERGGVGLRWQEFLALKARLEAEGLFDASRKRPLPRWPRRIGVVTSPQGAAYQDILRILGARYPLAEVILSPSLVQGEEAPASLVRALRRLDRPGEVDVIILARGGGSLEDLWAFNDENVARTVAASRVPIVTGVGHETDFTIVDFVADLRAPTPTAAATAVVPDVSILRQEIAIRGKTLESLVRGRLARLREQLEQEKRLFTRYHPRRILMEERQRLDDLTSRGTVAIQRTLGLWRMRLESLRARLGILDPRAALIRGFAMVEDASSGRLITRAEEAWGGQEIRIYVHKGRLDARVEAVSAEGLIS